MGTKDEVVEVLLNNGARTDIVDKVGLITIAYRSIIVLTDLIINQYWCQIT